MIYSGRLQNTYDIDPNPFAHGGEGSLHNVLNNSSLVAKIYLDGQLQQSTADKLLAMTKQINADNCQSIAWPVDVLYRDQKICGFIMKRFSGYKDLISIRDMPSLSWQKRILIAYNLCDVVMQIHNLNQCIGDMNPKNFGVDLNTCKVVSFDADSFHFRDQNRIYPCVVGVSDYFAPELHARLAGNVDLRTIDPQTTSTFTQDTDRFALAVLIFELLFIGYHPFTARRLENYGSSTTVHTRNTYIMNKISPFFNPTVGISYPREAPSISLIPPDIQNLFRKAFLNIDRPSPATWQVNLLNLLHSLKQCVRNHEHYYWDGCSECSWCALEKKKTTSNSAPQSNPTPRPNPVPQYQPTPKPNPSPVVPTRNTSNSAETSSNASVTTEQKTTGEKRPCFGSEVVAFIACFVSVGCVVNMRDSGFWPTLEYFTGVCSVFAIVFWGCFFVTHNEARTYKERNIGKGTWNCVCRFLMACFFAAEISVLSELGYLDEPFLIRTLIPLVGAVLCVFGG